MEINRYLASDFEQFEKHFRTNFINSLTGFKSASLVGSISSQGTTNLAIFSQVFHLGANPALIGLIIRPDTARRHTLENIEATGYFTLNHIRTEFYKQAHQTSARYQISEFEACNLTPEFGQLHIAPYVKESYVKIGLELAEKHRLEINGTILVIGRVIESFVPTNCISADGYIDIEKAGSLTCSSLDSYHVTHRLSRLSYAKPDEKLREISL